MDNIISRFPGLAEKIFDRLDNESLVNSRTVSRPWSEFTEKEMFFLKRIIKKLIGGYENFQETWKLVMKKADMEMMNELALAVKFFLSQHPGNCRDEENCKHRAVPRSPLHVAANAGQVALCEFILKITKDKNPGMKMDKFEGLTPLHNAACHGHLLICSMIMDEIQDKNPRDDSGWTPLHVATRSGHLSICSMIMDKIQDKNPRLDDGSTLLHYAALEGHLETFKMILNKAGTDINPSDNGGWTPLHYAARNGHKEMCKFIVGKVDEKNPVTNDGLTPQELMWDSICEDN